MEKISKDLINIFADIRKQARRVGSPISPRLTNSVIGTTGFREWSDLNLLNFLKEINERKFTCIKEVEEFKNFLKFWRSVYLCVDIPTNKHISSKAKTKLDDYVKKAHSGGWRTQIEHDLLNSKAFQNLRYVYSVKVLLWFYEKVKVEKSKYKRGFKRWTILKDGLTFTYEEAGARGVSRKQFSKALKELHSVGFIDFEKHGSGLMKDYSVYRLTDRWGLFGTPDFDEIQFPEPKSYGFGYGHTN
jgi:hypothetical protein